MKILCIADHIDPLVYSAGIKARFPEVELVLSAGDLPLNYYDFIMSMLNKPLYFVFGNHNLKDLDRFRGVADLLGRIPSLRREMETPAAGAVHLHARVRRDKGVLVAGMGGSRWYNGGANQYTGCTTGRTPAIVVSGRCSGSCGFSSPASWCTATSTCIPAKRPGWAGT
jgi:hypothetical protein